MTHRSTSPTTEPPGPATARQPGVRTFTPRWRSSPLTDERMARLMPVLGLPGDSDEPVDPVAVYGRRAPLVLEVGCGHGAAAIAYARTFPDHDVLASDVHVPGLARMMAAAHDAGVANLRVHNGDAITLLEQRLAPASLHAVHLFFPDPWPKKKHAKRRFVQQHTLALLADRLEAGGVLRVATDKDHYAEHTLTRLEEHGGWEVSTGDRPAWRPTDGFEDKGLDAGRRITEITARLR